MGLVSFSLRADRPSVPHGPFQPTNQPPNPHLRPQPHNTKTANLELALAWLELPRELGINPVTGEAGWRGGARLGVARALACAGLLEATPAACE